MERIPMIRLPAAVLMWLLLATCCRPANAQINNPFSSRSDAMPFNLKMKTMGGKQFWTDFKYVGGWKIQRNCSTGHHRLIDPQSVRHAWGTYDQCDSVLDQKTRSGKAVANQGRVVILLHGLMRSSASMQKIADHLREQGGYQVIRMQYASSRNAVTFHAASLHHLIKHLGEDVTEINFVAHSMGNIVIRHYLNDQTDPVSGVQGDPRINRMVMIGPPNQGSKLASVLKKNLLFKNIAGISGQQLGAGWSELEPRLATPNFEFGIIAGGQDDDSRFSNFVLSGKDDFTVAVSETKLVGAADFLQRPLLHSTMMKNQTAIESTLRFLQHGYFVSAESRQPITSLQVAEQK